jgi:5-methyltetrahydrofolate--homocysteine methyltransferase
MMGVTSSGMAEMVAGLDYQPIAFGANCGVGASDLLRTILGMAAANPNLPLIAKGNAGIPKYVDGKILYDGVPELMAEYAVLARDCGAKIIGGCCGTMSKHLAAMRHSLETRDVGQPPELATISTALGGFSSDSDGTGEQAAPTRTRRRRRA